MSTVPTDSLVRTLLPAGAIPGHLDPRNVLDPDFEPAPEHASRVRALRELVARGGRLEELGPKLGSSSDVGRYFSARMSAERVESIIVVGVDARLNVVFHRTVARGSVSFCSVRIADVLRPAILNAVSGIILVHNHPSGDATPSVEDVEFTGRVRDACVILGLDLFDHVVVSSRSHCSMLDLGLLARK